MTIINQNTISGVTECITDELYSICIEFYDPTIDPSTFISASCYNIGGGQTLIINESDYIDFDNICENNLNISILNTNYNDFFEIENNNIIFNAPFSFNEEIVLIVSGIDCLNRVIVDGSNEYLIIKICPAPLSTTLPTSKEIKQCVNSQTECSLNDMSIIDAIGCDLTIITLSSETANGIVDNISGDMFTYTPETGFTGSDKHILTVSGDCLFGILNIEINFIVNFFNLNAVNDFFRVQRLTGEILPVLDNDTYCCDDDELVLEIISGATYGVALVVSGDTGDRIAYTACDPCYIGLDSFVYSLTCDNITDTASVCVDVICNEFNADSFALTAPYCSAITINVYDLSNAMLPAECNEVEFVFTKKPMYGIIENNIGGTITYYANKCNLGDDLICGYLMDNRGCKSNIINIDITIEANPPTALPYENECEVELDCDSIELEIIQTCGDITLDVLNFEPEFINWRQGSDPPGVTATFRILNTGNVNITEIETNYDVQDSIAPIVQSVYITPSNTGLTTPYTYYILSGWPEFHTINIKVRGNGLESEQQYMLGIDETVTDIFNLVYNDLTEECEQDIERIYIGFVPQPHLSYFQFGIWDDVGYLGIHVGIFNNIEHDFWDPFFPFPGPLLPINFNDINKTYLEFWVNIVTVSGTTTSGNTFFYQDDIFTKINIRVNNNNFILNPEIRPWATGPYECDSPQYQWYLNDSPIDTGETITATTAGLYRIEITCDNECTYIGQDCIADEFEIIAPNNVCLPCVDETAIPDIVILYQNWLAEFTYAGDCFDSETLTAPPNPMPTTQVTYAAYENCCGNSDSGLESREFKYTLNNKELYNICSTIENSDDCGDDSTIINIIGSTIEDIIPNCGIDHEFVDIRIIYDSSDIYTFESVPVSSTTLGCLTGNTNMGTIGIIILPNAYFTMLLAAGTTNIDPTHIIRFDSFQLADILECPEDELEEATCNIGLEASGENLEYSQDGFISAGNVLRLYFMQGFAADKFTVTDTYTNNIIFSINASTWTTWGAKSKNNQNGIIAGDEYELCRSCDGVSGLTLLGDYFFEDSETWRWGDNDNYLVNITDDQYITANTCVTVYTYGINQDGIPGYRLSQNNPCITPHPTQKIALIHHPPTEAINTLTDWLSAGNSIPYATINGQINPQPQTIFSYVDIVFSADTNINISVLDNSCSVDTLNSQWAILTECFPITSITVTCPENFVIESCPTEDELDTAFNNWVTGFTYIGGCNVTDNKMSFAHPLRCGEERTYNYIAEDVTLGVSATCSATFTVRTPNPIQTRCPGDTTFSACGNQTEVDQAFNEWLNEFYVAEGGCGVIAETDLMGMYSAPSHTGGSVTVTYMTSDDCGQSVTCTATFTVEPNFALSSSEDDDGFNPIGQDEPPSPPNLMPPKFSICTRNDFPKLTWCNIPEGTQSLVLIVELHSITINGNTTIIEDNDLRDNIQLNAYITANTLPVEIGPYDGPNDAPNNNDPIHWESIFNGYEWYLDENNARLCDCLGNEPQEKAWAGPCGTNPDIIRKYRFKLYALNIIFSPTGFTHPWSTHMLETEYEDDIIDMSEIFGAFDKDV